MARLVQACSLALVFLGCLQGVEGGAAAVQEAELKAAYLYNFALFTTWPADKLQENEAALSFCVFGQAPVLAALGTLQNRKIRERRIVVRQVAIPEEGRTCHVLYLGEAAPEAQARMLDAVRDSGTLTVSDHESMRREAVISLVLDHDRLAFDVNLLNAQRSGLSLSSKLLKLARSVN